MPAAAVWVALAFAVLSTAITGAKAAHTGLGLARVAQAFRVSVVERSARLSVSAAEASARAEHVNENAAALAAAARLLARSTGSLRLAAEAVADATAPLRMLRRTLRP